MADNKSTIESLASWSDPKQVYTKKGRRLLRTAYPTAKFWDAWKSNKEELRDNGISVGKKDDGSWEVCWWMADAETEAKIEASRATDADVDLPKPDGLEYLGYQKAGIAWALNQNNILIGDEMGLGKTIQAIGIINADSSIKNVLIVCPASIKINWKRELEKWLVRTYEISIINSKNNGFVQGINIINFDILTKYSDYLSNTNFDALIVDEAHKIKNYKAQRTQAVFGVYNKETYSNENGIKARRNIFLTGTPIVNRPKELWMMAHHLDSKTFNSFWTFHKRYCDGYQDKYGWHFDGASNLNELQEKLRASIMIRRLKKDVLADLPPKTRQVVVIPCDDNKIRRIVSDERTAFYSIQDRLIEARAAIQIARLSDDEDAYRAAIESLRNVTTAAFNEIAALRYDTAVAKIPYVIEHVEDLLENEDKVVVFAHHHDVVNALMNHFGSKAVRLTGMDSLDSKQSAVDRFQNDPSVQIFVGSLSAAGVGITLTAASNVVFAELSMVPGDLSQCEDRLHRIGQQDNVLVQHLVLEESIDEWLANMLIEKQDIIDKALDDIKDIPVLPIFGDKEPIKTIKKDFDVILSPEMINLIHNALRVIAGMCDGAQELDGVGFNKFDTRVGRELAHLSHLTNKQAIYARKLVIKYQRQLSQDLIDKIKQGR